MITISTTNLIYLGTLIIKLFTIIMTIKLYISFKFRKKEQKYK